MYVSFAIGANKFSVQTAAQTIMNLPVLTTGLWGDTASEQGCLLDFASRPKPQGDERSLSFLLVLCPQANLISTVKDSGRSLQYRGQISKSEGEARYHHLAACSVGLLLEAQVAAKSAKEELSLPLPLFDQAWKHDHRTWSNKKLSWLEQQQQRHDTQPDSSVPPMDLFCRRSMCSAWDETTGIPTHDAKGQPVTKSALKKLQSFKMHIPNDSKSGYYNTSNGRRGVRIRSEISASRTTTAST